MKKILFIFTLSSCSSISQLQTLKAPVIIYAMKEATEFSDAAVVVKDSTGRLTGLHLDNNLNAISNDFLTGDTLIK